MDWVNLRLIKVELNGLILAKEYFFREPFWCLKRIVWYFIIKPELVIFYETISTKKTTLYFYGKLTNTHLQKIESRSGKI